MTAKELSLKLAQRAEAVAKHLFPNGKKIGNEYCIGSVNGETGKSLKICLSGEKAGIWSDFATGESGDLLNLFAIANGRNLSFAQAMQDAKAWLGIRQENPEPTNRANLAKPKQTLNIATTEQAKQAANEHQAIANLLKDGWRKTGFYEYQDENGNPIYWRVRLDPPENSKNSKWIRPFHFDGKEWILKEPPFEKGKKPLYQLLAIKNSESNTPIFIVEGEKCADALAKFGIVTTTSGSVTSANDADWSYLGGRQIIIWRDNDTSGLKYAEEVTAQLLKINCTVQHIDIEQLNLEPKDDCVDWLAANPTASKQDIENLPLIKLFPETQPLNENSEPAPSLKAITVFELLKTEFKPKELMLSPWLASQSLSMLYAYRGLGKTHVALNIAYAVASGGSFFSWQADKPRGVLFIDGEMPAIALQERIAAITAGAEKEATAPLVFLTPDLQEFGMPDLATIEGQEIIEKHITDEIKLIIVDNLSSLVRSGKENEAESWQPIQNWALQQRANGKSVLFIHHSNKSGNQRGTSRREDVLDSVISLKKPQDYTIDQGAYFEVHFEKARHLHGELIMPFEAQLITDAQGLQQWSTKSLEKSTFDKVVRLFNEGLSQQEISRELDINKSNVSRHLKNAREQGILK